MSHQKQRTAQGQALVEFALIIGVLLLFVFVIIESARGLQAWVTVQNAAREGARYAITGQFDPACLAGSPPCADPRVFSILERAERGLTGLALDPNAASLAEPNAYLIEVYGLDENGMWVADWSGLSGQPVAVRVTYRIPIITPLLRPIRESIAVRGQVIMNNEIFDQISQGQSDVGAPGIPPLPPPGPTDTPQPPDCPVHFIYEPIETINTEITVVGNLTTTVTLYDLTESQSIPLAGPANMQPASGLPTGCVESYYSAHTFTGLDLNGRAGHVLLVESSDGSADTSPIYHSPADLEIRDNEHVDSPDPVIEGNNVVYTIRVRNRGPALATNVILTDTLPSNTTFISAPGCNPPVGNKLGCEWNNIASGDFRDIQITLQTQQPGYLTNYASVSSGDGQPDPDTTNNSSSESTTVNELTIDLAVVGHTDTPDPVFINNEVTYVVTVGNNSATTANGVQIIDTLPTSATFVSASAGCTLASGVVTCDVGQLAGGATAQVTIVVEAPGTPQIIQNVVRVQGNETDHLPGNNLSSRTTAVVESDATLIVDPTCGSAGTVISVQGYNWPTANNYGIKVYWDATSNQIGAVPDSPENWSTTITVPAGTTDGTYDIIAVWRKNTGTGGSEVTRQTTLTVSCPATPTPTPSATPTLTPSPTPTPQPADLIVVGPPVLVSTPPISEYQPVELQIDISNIGESNISNQFFVGLYFDPAPAPDGSSSSIAQTYRVAVAAVSSLAAGNNKTVFLTADEGFVGAGDHTVYAVVDSEPPPIGLINEISEFNNISTPLSVSVQPGVPPTATPTPPPGDPGSLAGVVNVWINGNMVPQYNARVVATNGIGGSYVDYTDAEGIYYFPSLPAATYTLTGCINVEGVEYYGSYTGAVVSEGGSTITNLYLFQGTCP